MTYSPIYITIPEWIEIINRHNIMVSTVMEIGSMDGTDANELAQYYKAIAYIIEAHPKFAENIAAKYPEYNVYNLVASDKDGTTIFNCVTKDSANLGMSSMLDREESYPSYDIEYCPIPMESYRLDILCHSLNITSIDLLKIDVEGNSYEVLKGFGDMLWFVKCIHIECEHEPVWKGQKLYADVEKLLIGKGFIPVALKIGFPQSDSVWVKKEFYNHNWVA